MKETSVYNLVDNDNILKIAQSKHIHANAYKTTAWLEK